MELLAAGVDSSVIALWLGHESVQSTQMYLHADMTIKQRALERTAPLDTPVGRYQPPDTLLAFLEGLQLCRQPVPTTPKPGPLRSPTRHSHARGIVVDVSGVGGAEGLEAKVVDDQHVDAEQFAHLDLVAVVEPGRFESFEEVVSSFEVHAVAAADRGVAERGGQERFADPDGAEEQHVVAGVDEAQADELIEDGPVVGDLGGVIPVLE